MTQMETAPAWLEDDTLDEVAYCQDFLERHPMKCIQGRLFTVDGPVENEEEIKAVIFQELQPHFSHGVANKVNKVFEALKLMCYAPPMEPQLDRLHVANGTLFFVHDPQIEGYGVFTREKDFCLNRLNVNFNPDAPEPRAWLKFLAELLEPGDIPTLQEFLGYCLVPTNKAQKMLVIIGKGGEGKSRIGLVLQEILGPNMNTTSIQKVETNRFARADLEYKLLMVDDDMQMTALPQTSYLKTMVTLEGKMDIERKGQQSVQSQLYVRFLCFGNGSLSSLYDKSHGFYRRQIILHTKDRPPDRADDRNLIDKLRTEKEGILLWMLEGLRRLTINGYEFTMSPQATENLNTAMEDGNNIVQFLKSEGYIRFEQGTRARSVHLYGAYKRWCRENLETTLSARTFSQYLIQHAKEYGIVYSKSAIDGQRGFWNILVLVNPDRPEDCYKKL